MPRIILGIIVFGILAFTIGYFKARFQNSKKVDGSDRTALEEGSRILVLMLGIALIMFILFVAYTFAARVINGS